MSNINQKYFCGGSLGYIVFSNSISEFYKEFPCCEGCLVKTMCVHYSKVSNKELLRLGKLVIIVDERCTEFKKFQKMRVRKK